MSCYETVVHTKLACAHPGDRFVAAALTYDIAKRHGLEHRAYCELAIAASELASNAVRHGGGGRMEIRAIRAGVRRGVEILCVDAGEGIADVTLAMRDGISRGQPNVGPWGQGLGTGLGAVRRACPELEIESAPGRGTRVLARRWARLGLL
jgi:serine/threonine-protein kinase RsbT